MNVQNSSKKWYQERAIDALMRNLNSHTSKALWAGLLGSVAMVVAAFQPILVIIQRLENDTPTEIQPSTGWVLAVVALASVVLSLLGLREARTKRWAWGLLCVLCLLALAVSLAEALAGRWVMDSFVRLIPD